MKRLFLAVCAALMSVGVFAQEDIRWEGEFGMNVAKLTGPANSRVGYHLGARAKMGLPALNENVYANAGAFLSLKGASLGKKAKVSMNVLEIPIHGGYQYGINDKISVFGEFGPYFSIGLFGKDKTGGMDSDEDDNWGDYEDEGDIDWGDINWDDIDWGDLGYAMSPKSKASDWDELKDYIKDEMYAESSKTYDGYKRFDFGLGFRFGVEVEQKYTLALGYDLGVINAVKDGWGMKTKNRNFRIAIGYKF